MFKLSCYKSDFKSFFTMYFDGYFMNSDGDYVCYRTQKNDNFEKISYFIFKRNRVLDISEVIK